MIPLVHDGVTYNVHPMTDDMRAQYSAWMKSEAIKGTVAMKPYLPAKEYRDLIADLNSDICIRKLYEFGGEKCQAMSQTDSGSVQFLKVLLQTPGMPDALARKILEERSEELSVTLESLAPPESTSEGK